MADKEDGNTYDNWEELEDSGELDKQIEKIQLNNTPLQNGVTNLCPKPRSVIILSDDLRAKLLPPEPAVKILQRPNQNGFRNGLMNCETKPKQPLKTLQQREMEYAEARLRILGEARSPEEDLTVNNIDDSEKMMSNILSWKIQEKVSFDRSSVFRKAQLRTDLLRF
ncbi:SUZ RNA-binding domain-containing isoform X2 [Rhodnius prolixus]|uniref:SUZ RNA-binding domain-containing isoform X2 n=1 Tax=Rhodnius prolixus TaxID=13249 RepID=UPI003D18CE9C